ncbi:hypothetical protein AGMMS4956_11320 [Bacteroidia bacterium]|nr:hypothetical protein AGMMS4956_11320 [Bacteroidia bacterium]
MKKGTHGSLEQSFEELDFAGQARSITAQVLSVERAIKAHTRRAGTEGRDGNQVRTTSIDVVQKMIDRVTQPLSPSNVVASNMDAHAQSIVDSLGDKFNSHDFVAQFITRYEKDYVEMLYANKDKDSIFRTVHQQIGLYLGRKTTDLGIQDIGIEKDPAITRKEDNIHVWQKITSHN